MTRFHVCRWAAILALALAGPGAWAQAVLVVETDPAGAVVRVDGRNVGTAPVAVSLASGSYEVEGLFTGYAPEARSVTVTAGDTLRLTLALERLFGALDVAALPAGARVSVGGAPVEALPAMFPAGAVEVRVEVEGRRPVAASAVVLPDSTVRVAYRTGVLDPGALAFAALVPGGVQLQEGRTGPGGLLIGAFLGAGAGAALSSAAISDADADRAAAIAAYGLATSEQEAVALREEAAAATDRGRSARAVRTAFLGAAAAVYLLSGVDALRNHVWKPGLVVPPRVEAGPAPGGVALRIRL